MRLRWIGTGPTTIQGGYSIEPMGVVEMTTGQYAAIREKDLWVDANAAVETTSADLEARYAELQADQEPAEEPEKAAESGQEPQSDTEDEGADEEKDEPDEEPEKAPAHRARKGH